MRRVTWFGVIRSCNQTSGSKDEAFTSRLSAFVFVHPAQARLNSTPQLLALDRRAVAQGAQLARAICGCTGRPAAEETAVRLRRWRRLDYLR